MKKTPTMRLIEIERGEPLEELLRQMTEDGRTQEQIARELSVSMETLRNWVRRLGGKQSIRFTSDEKASVS